MSIILHITHRQQWEQAKDIQAYRGDTLETEGFIHCSTPLQVIKVVNFLFPNQHKLIVLCIDSDKIQAEIRYEGFDRGEQFPHIYGSLNIDAVIKIVAFEHDENGKFKFPSELAELG